MRKFLSLLLCMFILTGCNGSREPEERDYVMVVAVDKNYDTYVSVARPNRDSSAEPKEDIISSKGESITDSIRKINKKSRGQLYFGHTVACIVDKSLLKNSKIVDEIITTCRNSSQFARNILLFSSENVKSVMEAEPDNTTVSGYIEDYTQVNKSYSYDINDMIKAVTHNREIVPPEIKADKNAINITK